MREITIKAYQYDELNEKAKTKAREWFALVTAGDEFWEFTYDDAENIGIKITGFDLYRRTIGGEIITSAPEVIESIMRDHGKDCATYKTALRYKPAFEALEGKRDANDETFEDEFESVEGEFIHDILEDYLSLLQEESDYRQSDEYIEEGIRINEYEFTEEGKRI